MERDVSQIRESIDLLRSFVEDVKSLWIKENHGKMTDTEGWVNSSSRDIGTQADGESRVAVNERRAD